MGQHKRLINCIECPATAALKVVTATWEPTSAASGGGTSTTRWLCPTCDARRRAPKVSNFAKIKLPPRPPVSNSVARLRDLVPQPAAVRHTDERLLEQLASRSTPPSRPGITRAAPRRFGTLVALMGLAALVPESTLLQERETALAKAPRIIREMDEFLTRLGDGFQIAVTRLVAGDLEGDACHIESLRALHITISPLLDHPNNTAEQVVLEVYRT